MTQKLKVIDDEVRWVDTDVKDVILTHPLEFVRPTEHQARRLYKYLKELFEGK